MPTPTEELAQALSLVEMARNEVENAKSRSAAVTRAFLGDADRMLIDADAAAYRGTQLLGWPDYRIPDSSHGLDQLSDVQATLEQMVMAARAGSPAPAYAATVRGGGTDAVAPSPRAGLQPGDHDPFAVRAVFDPKNSLKAQTHRQGMKMLLIGISLAVLSGLAGACMLFLGDQRLLWLIAPLPGLGIAGKGFIELLHARDM